VGGSVADNNNNLLGQGRPRERSAFFPETACTIDLNGSDDMRSKPYHVLFLCTGNSARSIMAEGLMTQLGASRFRAYSAGSHPTGIVNPFALHTLRKMGMPADGFRSKSWDEFAAPHGPQLDFVLTVCDNAAGEVCPLWPGRPMTAHWGVPDPAAVEGPDELKAKQFRDTALLLRRRIELMLALPFDTLDSLGIDREMKDIGNR
jgi:arsenate reductase (thioredoxin)